MTSTASPFPPNSHRAVASSSHKPHGFFPGTYRSELQHTSAQSQGPSLEGESRQSREASPSPRHSGAGEHRALGEAIPTPFSQIIGASWGAGRQGGLLGTTASPPFQPHLTSVGAGKLEQAGPSVFHHQALGGSHPRSRLPPPTPPQGSALGEQRERESGDNSPSPQTIPASWAPTLKGTPSASPGFSKQGGCPMEGVGEHLPPSCRPPLLGRGPVVGQDLLAPEATGQNAAAPPSSSALTPSASVSPCPPPALI